MKCRVCIHAAKTIFFFIVLVSVLFFQGSFACGQELTATQKEVWQMEKSVWEHWKKGEMDAFRKLFDKNCAIWFQGDSFPVSKNTFLWGIDSWIESFKLKPYEIKVFNDLAIVQFLSVYETPSKSVRARCTSIWRKQNGKWIIIGSMGADCERSTPCP